MIHFSPDLIALSVAIPVGMITYRKSNPGYLRIFPFFLLLTLLTELLGELYQDPGKNNIIIFNLFTILEFSFYLFFFKSVIPSNSIKKAISITQIFLPIICLVNVFFIQGRNVFHTHTYTISCIVMVVYGIIYFYQLFNQEKKINLLREPAFWVSIDIVFFFISAFSIMGALNYISTLSHKMSYLLQSVFHMLNVLFYCLFIIAFLCQKNILKSSPRL